MNLDGPGYALSLLLIGEIVILAMAFFAGGLGFGGRSFPTYFQVTMTTFMIHDCHNSLNFSILAKLSLLNTLDT